LLALRSRGELIGEQSALEDEPRSASVISASPVTAYVIQPDDFLQYLESHSDVQIAVARALSAKLRWATRQRTDFSGLATDVRVARVLSELARMNSRLTRAGTELGYGLTQPDLAALVGVSEPSLQRALRKLRESGVLDTGRRKIVILDMARLHTIAGPEWTGSPEAIK
jgi:CRP/FNR family transcriptional regulator, cyclic AMP receptor protein